MNSMLSAISNIVKATVGAAAVAVGSAAEVSATAAETLAEVSITAISETVQTAQVVEEVALDALSHATIGNMSSVGAEVVSQSVSAVGTATGTIGQDGSITMPPAQRGPIIPSSQVLSQLVGPPLLK